MIIEPQENLLVEDVSTGRHKDEADENVYHYCCQVRMTKLKITKANSENAHEAEIESVQQTP